MYVVHIYKTWLFWGMNSPIYNETNKQICRPPTELKNNVHFTFQPKYEMKYSSLYSTIKTFELNGL